MKSLSIIAALAASALSACTGLDTGNGSPQLAVALSVSPGAPPDASGAQFQIASAVVNVGHVEFYLPDGRSSCAGLEGLSPSGGDYTVTCDGDKIRARGPWKVDLVTRASTPPLPTVPVFAGTYRRVDVRFEPDTLGVTLTVTGTAPVGAAGTPFSLVLEFTDDLRFEGTPIVASGDAVAKVLLTLDPTGWFAALPLTQCAAEGELEVENGVLELEDGDGECSELEDTIQGALTGSGSLEEDDEDEHELEDDPTTEGEPENGEHGEY